MEYTLASFDFDAPILMRIPSEQLWESVPALAFKGPAALIVGMFEPISQMERGFSAALRRANMPSLCLAPERASTLKSFAKEAPLSIVVSQWRTREQLEPVLGELAEVRAHFVLAPGERPEFGRPHTSYEVHAAPGLVALWQCNALFGTNAFHSGTHATKLDDPHTRASEKACACGAAETIELL